MPYIVSDQAIHVAENGVDARFQAGVTRFVRPSLQAVAERHGARVVEETPASTKAEPVQQAPNETPTDEQVREAIQALMESGDIEAFDTQQAPKARELTKWIGERVTAAQRDRVWEQFDV